MLGPEPAIALSREAALARGACSCVKKTVAFWMV